MFVSFCVVWKRDFVDRLRGYSLFPSFCVAWKRDFVDRLRGCALFDFCCVLVYFNILGIFNYFPKIIVAEIQIWGKTRFSKTFKKNWDFPFVPQSPH